MEEENRRIGGGKVEGSQSNGARPWLAMAAVIEGDVKKNLLDRTDAEKVFRPWWDTLEDYLLNILILIGQPKYLSIRLIGFIKLNVEAKRSKEPLICDHLAS